MTSRDRLIEQYAAHYLRVNAGTIPTLSSRACASMQSMYGPLIAPLPFGSRILDVGCGTGLLLSWLARQDRIMPVGVDSSASQVEQARRYIPSVEVVCADGLSYLRNHHESFAGIFCLDVLEHLPGIDLCMQWIEAACDALRPGGFFFCRVPNAANLAAPYSRYLDLTHDRCFASASLLQLMETGGLVDCRIMPLRAPHLTGRIRLYLEAVLHRAVFRICGHGQERTFTNNLHAVGYKSNKPF